MAAVDVLVGTIGRPHGLRGAVVVRTHTDFPDARFATGAELTATGVRSGVLTVASSQWVGDSLVVCFHSYSDRSAAEALRGIELWAGIEPGQDAADDYHDLALIGLEVRSAGEDVGKVTSILHHPGQDLLVVTTAAGERLVPFVAALVPVVDLARGYVEVAAVPGLLRDTP